MSDKEVNLTPDDPPKSGVWVDTCDVLPNPTPEELAEGERLGQVVRDEAAPEPLSFLTRAAVSDRGEALEEAQRLKEHLLAVGVPEVSIELLPGRPNSFGVWNALFAVADMSHHTVSRYGSNKTPVLALCRNGRSDLPGPLCNGYGGWDLCYRIITMGYANHPGAGGPINVPATNVGSFNIPRDSARRYAFGTEYEGGLSVADWDRTLTNPRTGDKMTFREFMDRANAGIQNYLNIPAGAHMEHSTWTSRKIDRLGISRAEGIAGLSRFRDQEEIVTPDDIKAIADEVTKTLLGEEIKIGKDEEAPLARVIRWVRNDGQRILKELRELNAKLDGEEPPPAPKA